MLNRRWFQLGFMYLMGAACYSQFGLIGVLIGFVPVLLVASINCEGVWETMHPDAVTKQFVFSIGGKAVECILVAVVGYFAYQWWEWKAVVVSTLCIMAVMPLIPGIKFEDGN